MEINKDKGFTLIEVIMVIAIVGIIAGISLPSVVYD
ncbi:prepilin-type N-terminal cleavage/methylation domain-containing protein [Cytobacillus firmus]